MRRLFYLILLALPPVLQAQTPGRAVPDALMSLLSGPGSCFGEFDQQRLAYPTFPNVTFYQGLCIAEHGDSASAIVALDADSVLYLLESQEAFNFLISRHPPHPAPDTPDYEYARLALELAGALGAPTRLVTDPPKGYPKPWRSQQGKQTWTVGFTTVSPAQTGPRYRAWTVYISRGSLWLYRESEKP